MKKKIILFLLPLIMQCELSMAQSQLTHVVVWLNDGSKTVYLLQDRPVVSLSETELKIKTSTVSASCPLKMFQRITYSDDVNTGISDIVSKAFEYDGDNLAFVDCNDKTTVYIYTLDGKLILQKKIKENSNIVSLNSLHSGVYIVKVNGSTFKILKK